MVFVQENYNVLLHISKMLQGSCKLAKHFHTKVEKKIKNVNDMCSLLVLQFSPHEMSFLHIHG